MPQINWDSPLIKAVPNILALLVLVFILLFVTVQFGFVRSCDIPGFTPIYYAIVGTPDVAIIYEQNINGEYTIGNPEMLANSIMQRKHIAPAMYPIDAVLSADMLSEYALIFVEAKKIDTATMLRFQSYLSKGGKLVWIGDSGTEIGDDDYICQRVTFKYLAASSSSDSVCDVLKVSGMKCSKWNEDKTECTGDWEQTFDQDSDSNKNYVSCINHECGTIEDSGAKEICKQATQGKIPADSWMEYSPNIPYDLGGGICGKDFEELVLNYKSEYDELYSKLTTGSISLYDDESFIVEDAQNLEACINLIEEYQGLEVDRKTISDNCKFNKDTYKFGANYWSRGPSETYAGDYVPEVNFANILGVDFIDLSEEANLEFRPILQSHPLMTGYEIQSYLGTADVTKVSTTRFPVRSNTIMSIEFGKDEWWPAVVVSNPLGPSISGRGLVVYFAFPPESGLTSPQTGAGANLINNLIDFALCA